MIHVTIVRDDGGVEQHLAPLASESMKTIGPYNMLDAPAAVDKLAKSSKPELVALRGALEEVAGRASRRRSGEHPFDSMHVSVLEDGK